MQKTHNSICNLLIMLFWIFPILNTLVQKMKEQEFHLYPFTLFLYLYPRSNITQTILNLEGSTLTCFRKEGYIWVKMRAKSGLKWNNCAIRKYSIIVCRRGAIKMPNIITAGCKSIASQGFIHLLKFTNEAYLEYYVMSIVWSILLLKIG